MDKFYDSIDFNSNGKPCDFIDDDGTIWIYLGERDAINEWGGIPKED